MFLNKFKQLLCLSAVIISFANASSVSESGTQSKLSSAQQKLAQLEKLNGGRLGVAAINTANNQRIQYRGEERFPMCSTSKFMVAAAILNKSRADPKLLATNLHYTQGDLNSNGYAPIAKEHLATGMTVGEMCQAALNYSDNVAMNMLLKQLGGPRAVTAYARSIGDNSFRLDRKEPELNSAIPGDKRDTTTPLAMQNSLQNLALGVALEPVQRQKLQDWLKNNTTGKLRISAGVPKDWLVGDKTGTGKYGSTNDVGVIWPTGAEPIVLAVYFTQSKPNAKANDKIIADATRIVVEEFAKNDSKLKLSYTDKLNESNPRVTAK